MYGYCGMYVRVLSLYFFCVYLEICTTRLYYPPSQSTFSWEEELSALYCIINLFICCDNLIDPTVQYWKEVTNFGEEELSELYFILEDSIDLTSGISTGLSHD